MKRLFSLMLVLVFMVSVLPNVVLAGSSTDGKILIREYVPGTDNGVVGNTNTISVTTTSDGSEYYYSYKSLTGASDAPLGYIPITSALTEITFMLTDEGSSVGFMPTFYDENKTTTDKYSYTQILNISKNNGVVITNIKDASGAYIFSDTDIRWSNNKLTLIPHVTMNEKHTLRIEHDPDSLRFTVWFDSNKIDITENSTSAFVKSTATAATGAENAKGPRFIFAGSKNQTMRVYDMYIRGTQKTNTDVLETARIFSGARDYNFVGNSSSNIFSYYVDKNSSAVITGFKYGKVPSDTYTATNPLVFPSSIDGHTVTAIADYAFNEDNAGNKTKDASKYVNYDKIFAIELPNTLKTIGQYSMVGFKNITELVLQNSVTEVGNYAFDHVYNSTNKTPSKLVFGNSLTKIGNMAFNYFGYNGARIEEVVVPESVTEIGTQAFALSGIRTIIFEGAPTIGTNMFRNNKDLQKVVFLKDVTLGSGFFGLAGNQNTNKNICIVGSRAMYDAACENAKAATVENYNYSHSDVFVYESALVPSVYYWGTDDDATLIKAQYNKSSNELESCVSVPMTAGNNYPLELGNGTYNVKNFVWSMGDCKPITIPTEY